MTRSRCAAFAILMAVGMAFPLFSEEPKHVIIPHTRFGLEWKTELQDPIVLLRMWFTVDNGATWRLYSQTENPATPAPVKVKDDGVYGFYTQCKDRAGLEEPLPVSGTKPKIMVTVDTKKPGLTLIQPNTAEVHNTSETLRVEWSAEDVNFDSNPISLFYSLDGGATWVLIAKNIPNTRVHQWKLPAESSQMCKVKAVAADKAGNNTEAVSDNCFTIDGKPPVSIVTGPREAKAMNFEVSYNVRDVGGAGVAKVALYFQVNDDKTWHAYGEDQDLTSPMAFEAKMGGRYGFKMVATDRVNNSEDTPNENTKPDLVCLMDSAQPVVKLLSFKGTGLAPAGGGTLCPIKWEATDDNMAENPIKIEYSEDDGATWNMLTAATKNTGQYPWVVAAKTETKQARLRVTAMDVLGNTGFDVSDPFGVDLTAPISNVIRVIPLAEDEAELANQDVQKKMKVVPPDYKPEAPPLGVEDLITRVKNDLNFNNLASAEENARKAIGAAEGSYEARYWLGRVLFAKNELKDAMESYGWAIKLNGEHQESRIGLGSCLVLIGNGQVQTNPDEAKLSFQKAEAEYEESAKILPDLWDEYFNLGYVQARLSKPDQAISSFNKAVSLNPENGDAYWYLGQIYHTKKGDLQKALECYQNAAKRYPEGNPYRKKSEDRARELEDLLKK